MLIKPTRQQVETLGKYLEIKEALSHRCLKVEVKIDLGRKQEDVS